MASSSKNTTSSAEKKSIQTNITTPLFPAGTAHSNALGDFLAQLASASDPTSFKNAQMGMIAALKGEKKVGETRADDTLLAGIMGKLGVKKDDEDKSEDKGKGMEV